MEFIPYGGQDKIRLTIKIVREIASKPTKSGKQASDKDCMQFMMLCSARRLNPFEGDAYLVGYDSQDGPQFNLITAEMAFLKRAELHPQFDGLESGMVVQNEDGSTQELEGELLLQGQICIGGWARCFIKERKIPMYDRLSVKKYFKQHSPFWRDNPEHQIAKCARVAVLRRSFATQCGGLYLREEIEFPTMVSAPMDIPTSRLVEVKSSAPASEDQDQEKAQDEQKPSDRPQPAKPEPAKKTPNDELKDFAESRGYTLDQLVSWGRETGQIPDGAIIKDWYSFPEKDVVRWLRARKGLEDGLARVKQTTNV